MKRVVVILFLSLILFIPITPSVSADDGNVSIVEVYPDTYEDGDAGEYISIRFNTPTNTTGWTLSDGEDIVKLQQSEVNGTLYVGRNSPLGLQLANSGDEIVLRNSAGRVVDEMEYGEKLTPSEGEVLVREDGDNGWTTRHVGASDFEYKVYNISS
ncbi:MAG: lamin tail domain-containing protein, partial [Halobacteria archaeon]|nr:lamin tail domain-containing protein [Halobacteria archaeon]